MYTLNFEDGRKPAENIHFKTFAMEASSSAYFQKMRNVLAQWVVLTDYQWLKFSSVFEVKKYQPLDHLLLPGVKEYELLFTCEGLLRFYYCGKNGEESNKAFIPENAFVGPLASSVLDLPVIFGIQAIESSICLTANFSDFAELFNEDPIFDRLGRLLAESLLVRKELRTRSLLQENAQDRYLNFLSQESDIARRIPQYHIASYLGITEVSLSRIKNSLKKESAFNPIIQY